MRTSALLLLPLFFVLGCGGGGDGPARPDSGSSDAGSSGMDAGPGVDAGGGADAGPADSGSAPVDLGPAQELSATLTADACGNLHAAATVDVPTGSTVTICAGSVVTFDAGAALRVHGTLHIAGTAAARVTLAGNAAQWTGLSVFGTLDAHFTDMTDAHLGVQTLAGATSTYNDSTITVPDTSSIGFDLAGGGTFDRTHITGGTTNGISGGTLSMTDSVIDLLHPAPYDPPDCTHNDGGNVVLDHVHITGCHCPLHFNRSDSPSMITNSILDHAVDSTMVANMTGTFHNNAMLGTGINMLDIGGSATVDIAGNYWGTAHPSFFAYPSSTFTGTSDAEALTAMPAGIGPR